MNYLLDTSVLIDLLRQKSYVWNFLQSHPKDKFLTSTICEAELWEGVFREKSADVSQKRGDLQDLLGSLFRIIPFDSDQAQIAGQIRATLSLKGEKTGDLDALIGATAIISDAVLITSNPKHFSRIKNLQILELPAS